MEDRAGGYEVPRALMLGLSNLTYFGFLLATNIHLCFNVFSGCFCSFFSIISYPGQD